MFLKYDKFINSLNIHAYGVINLLYLVILKRQAKILSRTQIFLFENEISHFSQIVICLPLVFLREKGKSHVLFSILSPIFFYFTDVLRFKRKKIKKRTIWGAILQKHKST